MPKFTLDGNEVEFQPGETIIEAAKKVGVDIPHFCWHPSLSVSGNCRVCLVEIEKMPKLAIACSTIASEGMVVHSQSEKTLSARNAVMEFLLINHPLDCPICDEAGECKLQDYAYQHSVGESRFTEEKQHKDKRVPLGPNVMFDGERCISCSRCIRFADEITKTGELTFVQRGDRVTIVTFPGKEFDNAYSLNVTDICPVGALTNRDFRFKARVWDMSATKTICSGCARGCNTEVWVRNNEILRLTPRQNDAVNSYWMCDHGRLETFKQVHSAERVNGVYMKREGQDVKVSWDEAYANAAGELKHFNKDEIAVIASASSTCEDNFMLAKFAKSVLSTKHIDYIPHVIPGSGDDLLIREDKSPNALGTELAGVQPAAGGLNRDAILEGVKKGTIKALIVVDEDLAAMSPEMETALAKLDVLIAVSTHHNRTTALANIIFPSAAYAEKNGTWVNFQGRIQRIRPAVTTLEADRTLDNLAQSRLDKFGTEFDRWGKSVKLDARPVWKIFAGLSTAFGNKMKYNTAEDVLIDMGKSIDAFKKLDYEKIGEQGVQLEVSVKVKA
ncbi:MAG: 2Fe-2S iron-sulfur cluster-binding protein [Ignavibacteriaceae bacterium]|nr:2Fe-2S iron-sulfur cluster-binding protein [Ignavibacteriaceae bacterium]